MLLELSYTNLFALFMMEIALHEMVSLIFISVYVIILLFGWYVTSLVKLFILVIGLFDFYLMNCLL